jgi:hypothetical protein
VLWAPCRFGSQSLQTRVFSSKVFWNIGLAAILSDFAGEFFYELFWQSIINKQLKPQVPRASALQSIVKEGLTRKVFRSKDLAGQDCRSWRISPNDLLRECARVHCALFSPTVKVIGHMEGEFGCGKATESSSRTSLGRTTGAHGSPRKFQCSSLSIGRYTKLLTTKCPVKAKSGLNGTLWRDTYGRKNAPCCALRK